MEIQVNSNANTHTIQRQGSVVVWQQKGTKLWFEYKGIEIFFIMPAFFNLTEIHPDLLYLSEWMMFSPFHELPQHQMTRKQGTEIGLNFSAGVDSTANLLILPETTHLVYVERDFGEFDVINQANALFMIEKLESLGRKVLRVKTNFELIRSKHGLSPTYSTALGMGVPLILLADHLHLGYTVYGKVMDDQFFPHGVLRPLNKTYHARQEMLKNAGLTGLYPTVGCAEVITTKIIEQSELAPYSYSCVYGELGKQCNSCFKCFRKNLLRGKHAFIDLGTREAINSNPSKMVTSLIYALQRNGATALFDATKEFKDLDLSLLERVYTPAYEGYTALEKDWILSRLSQFGFPAMTATEEKALESLDFRRKTAMTAVS